MTKLITIAPLDDDGTANGLYHYKICGLDNYWLTPDLYERGPTEGIETPTFPRLFDVQAAIGMHVCSLDRPLNRQGGSVPAHRYWLHAERAGECAGL